MVNIIDGNSIPVSRASRPRYMSESEHKRSAKHLHVIRLPNVSISSPETYSFKIKVFTSYFHRINRKVNNFDDKLGLADITIANKGA